MGAKGHKETGHGLRDAWHREAEENLTRDSAAVLAALGIGIVLVISIGGMLAFL